MCKTQGRIRIPHVIGIVLMPIRLRIRIWIGIKMDIWIRIRADINTMPIHNTGSE